jgi:hypothetical protein
MKVVAAIALVAALGATPSASPVTLHATNMTFKEAITTCAGALGSVTFSLGHTRLQAADGVNTDEDETSPGAGSVTFTNASNGKSATATINAAKRSVSAKHLTVKGNNSVACVYPD